MEKSRITGAPAPWGPVPSQRQLAHHSLETYGFVHFTVNTFTDKEWGYGDEPESVFNPTSLDAAQWVQAAKSAGLKGLIITAKHHDGFCLWPTKYTDHSVRNSPWKDGKGDVVGELEKACREAGLLFGVYLSPWDRNRADYGSESYVDYYKEQLVELLTSYGDIFEMWFDGANGGDGFYGGTREMRKIDHTTYYGFPELWDIVRKYQPNCIMFSDAGPDVRWIGNEEGFAPEQCWSKVDPEGIVPGKGDVSRLAKGEADGTVWRPGEVDVSIRKGWFYHDSESPRTPDNLMELYFSSVGRGCSFLLNITPDKRGLIPDEDAANLAEYGRRIAEAFKTDLALGAQAEASEVRGGDPIFGAQNVVDGNPDTYWTVEDGTTTAWVQLELPAHVAVNCIRIEEYIALGQRVESFAVEANVWGGWVEVARGTTIGAHRILRFPKATTGAIRLRIEKAQACPVIKAIKLYDMG